MFCVCSKHLQVVLRELEAAAELVSEQMESICQQCSWLSDVSEFVRSWKGSEWEYNMLADEFEVREVVVLGSAMISVDMPYLGLTESALCVAKSVCCVSIGDPDSVCHAVHLQLQPGGHIPFHSGHHSEPDQIWCHPTIQDAL